jgi:hypothetical protein
VTTVAAVDPALAREQARDVLDGERFREPSPPRPLRGLLEWIADRLRDVGDAVAAVLAPVPGPTWIAVGGLLVVAAAAALASALRRRRGGSVRAVATTGPPTDVTERASDLERAADAADARGDYECAVRLRFRAGLRRLADAGTIELRPGVTNGAIARRLRSADYDDLRTDFEEVTYGGRPATAPDSASARERWPRVLSGTR